MALWNKFFGGENAHTTDAIDEIQQRLADGTAVMLDVRSDAERAEGFLRGSVFIPVDAISQMDEESAPAVLAELSDGKVIYCHCRMGGRAQVAATILRGRGFDVRTLPHSFLDLVQLGFDQET